LFLLEIPLRRTEQVERLSDAERSVLRLLVRGAPDDLIAWARGSTLRTVTNQVASVLAKTGALSRYELCFAFADADLGPSQARPSPRARRDRAGSLLIAEDDHDVAQELSALFGARGFEVTTTRDLASSREALAQDTFDAAVVDVVLGDHKATELLGTTKTPIVLISGRATFEDIAWGLTHGAIEFVSKAAPIDTLLGAVGDAATRGEPQWLPDLDVDQFSALEQIEPATVGKRILAGELRCVLEAEWQGLRRFVLETTEPALPVRASEVGRLAATGMPMKRVSSEIGVSEATAWLDLKRFLEHAGLRDRVQLARMLGYCSTPRP
jgi:DNA-binding NarL/FixJ family response regulator